MERILKTRKTVKHYVIFNLVFMCISIVVGVYIELTNNPDVQNTLARIQSEGDGNTTVFLFDCDRSKYFCDGRYYSHIIGVLLLDLWSFIETFKIELQRFKRTGNRFLNHHFLLVFSASFSNNSS